MLTPSDYKNIRMFGQLTPTHQRVFRHRLRKKFQNYRCDLEYVLQHQQLLKLRIEEILDLEQLKKLFELAEQHHLLQDM